MRENLSRMTLIILLVAYIIIQGVSVGNSTSGMSTTTISVNPPENTYGVGEKFSVNITVTNVEDLYGWTIQMLFNPSILQVDKDGTVFTTWLKDNAEPPDCILISKRRLPPFVPEGTLFLGQVLLEATSGATGNGTLAIVTFEVISTGGSLLQFEHTELNTIVGSATIPIDHEAFDGVFDNRVGNEPPVAIFNAEALAESPAREVAFNASASYDPDAWLVSYKWDFGDNTTVIYMREYLSDVNLTDFANQNFTTYHAYDEVGTYRVELTVTDNDGATNTATANITVNYDVAITNLTISPTKVKPGDPVTINATVKNEGNFTTTADLWVATYYDGNLIENKSVKYDAPPIGTNLVPGASKTLNFMWNTTGVAGGKYTIKAVAANMTGETDTDDNTRLGTVTVLSPPVADFTYTSLVVNKTVTFTSTSYDPDGYITNWDWDLDGDGNIDATTETTTYTYTEAKDYTVSLTVTDNDTLTNTKAVTLTVYINVTHNVAITNITLSTTEVIRGEELTIKVEAKNKGSETETFNVTVRARNETATEWKLIGTKNVTNLHGGSATTLNFNWNTTDVSPGNYIIKAEASEVVNETDTTDNMLNRTVKIIIRDIAVTNVTVSPTEVTPGESVTISVTVKNEGTEMEDRFNVAAYYNESLIRELTVTNLDPSASRTLNFQWDTTGVTGGEYIIKTVAETVPGETDKTDNERTYNGKVTVLSPPVADFTYTPEFPLVSETVIFNASTSYDPDGYITNWDWDLDGDGNIDATTETTTYTYTVAGTYTVTLTVKDDKGLTNSIQASLTVVEYPNAVFTYSPETPIVGDTVTFNASGSSDTDGWIASYIWDFDDGNVTTVSNVTTVITHTFAAAGLYKVTLNVTDNDGLTNTYTQSINIGKMSSTIDIDLSPKSITLGENTTISGFIDPERPGVTVTIWYRLKGEETWSKITTPTDENSQYSHVWTPDSTGTYEIKASWEGDENTFADETEKQELTVQEAPPDHGPATPLSIIAAIVAAVIIITIIVGYFFIKARKPT